jgi:hypothetical protein
LTRRPGGFVVYRSSLTRQIALEHTKPAPKGQRAFFISGDDMVKTREQAERIQRKRYLAGKLGVSKAVRRFMRRTKQAWDCGLEYNRP